MKKALFIKALGFRCSGSFQALYKLEPSFQGVIYVVASAVSIPLTGSETYLFRATPEGEITSYRELPGSLRGTMRHRGVLEYLGYTVIGAPDYIE